MFAYVLYGVFQYFIPAGTAFEIDGVQYPANWLNLSTPEEKASLGIVDVVYGDYPNDQYYWVTQDAPVYANGVVTVDYTATPKDLFECQSNAVNATNSAAYSILLPSDWMVVKGIETGTTVPPAWNSWRQTIRTQASDYVKAITACTTVDQLAKLPPIVWTPDPDHPQNGA
jgi:hypothetical protein